MRKSSENIHKKNLIASKYYVPPKLDSSSIVIDGGAYVGAWTEHMVNTYRCKIVAVEPYYENIDALRLRFAHLPGLVSVVDIAIAGTNGLRTLFLSTVKYKNNHHSLFDRFTGKARRRTGNGITETVTISTLLARCKLERVDLLKLNIEGAEAEALLALDEATAAKIRCICFASHFDKIITKAEHNKVVKHLRFLSYKVTKHTSEGWGPTFSRYVCKR